MAISNDNQIEVSKEITLSGWRREKREKSRSGDLGNRLRSIKRCEKTEVRLNLSLIKIRQEIDRLDEKILALLERRFALAISTVESKRRLRDRKREMAIIARLGNKFACSHYLTLAFIKKIYGLIFNQSLALEKRQLRELRTKRKKQQFKKAQEEKDERERP